MGPTGIYHRDWNSAFKSSYYRDQVMNSNFFSFESEMDESCFLNRSILTGKGGSVTYFDISAARRWGGMRFRRPKDVANLSELPEVMRPKCCGGIVGNASISIEIGEMHSHDVKHHIVTQRVIGEGEEREVPLKPTNSIEFGGGSKFVYHSS